MAFRKSFRIGGVRVTTSRGGVGYSVGGKGVRLTKRADGRVTRTVRVPGTGLSHTAGVGGRRRSRGGLVAGLVGAVLGGLAIGRRRRRR